MLETLQNPDYLKIPNYERAQFVDMRDARSLSPPEFRHDFIHRNTPCLIKGAALHWEACSKWRSLEYLKARCGSVDVEVHSVPVIEADPLLSSPQKRAWLKMLRLTRQPRKVPFSAFLDEAVSEAGGSAELLFLYSVPLGPGGLLAELAQDVGGYPFLPGERRAIFGTYPRNNVYFYQSSLTDWHYHPTAEALQTQILGTKEVLLLPPSEQVWSYMSALQAKSLHLYDADLSRFQRAREVVPYRIVLEPGDALYIPTYWWHLVSTRGHRTLGATVPTWWRTPLRIQLDPRFPAGRAAVRALMRDALVRARSFKR